MHTAEPLVLELSSLEV